VPLMKRNQLLIFVGQLCRFDEESAMDEEEIPEQPASNGFAHPPRREPFVKSEQNLQNLLVPQPPVVFKRQFSPQPAPRVESKENVYYETLSDQRIFDLPALSEKPKINDVIAYRVKLIYFIVRSTILM
jgi:hypothetical protein